MCAIIVAWRVCDGVPLAVAADRTEQYGRPSVPPRVIEEDPLIIAPQDEQAGGTWMGHNEHGVVAAVTNRWTNAELAGDRSRGLLVRDALARQSAAEAAEFIADEVLDHEFAGFYLVVADTQSATLVQWDGELTTHQLDSGVHIVVNVGSTLGFDIPESGRANVPGPVATGGERQAQSARAARDVLETTPGETPREWLDRVVATLCEHKNGFCIHSYAVGTTSASTYILGADQTVRAEFADGPPYQTEFAPVTTGMTQHDSPS